jgi:hypothetical protein
MKEIGGYFELDGTHGKLPWIPTVTLNSARNALRYILRAHGVKEIFVPRYTCQVVFDAIAAENCQIHLYEINENLSPAQQFPAQAFILANNYFGICGRNIDALESLYPNLIVDDAQSFYARPRGLASFSSPRKFFGLPDGGLAFLKKHLDEEFEIDTSYERCAHLLKRVDVNAQSAYADFCKNDKALENAEIKTMSKLTERILSMQDFNWARKRRLENFSFLHKTLGPENRLRINLAKDDVPMVYPFLCENDGLREKLISKKIFVARYWPNCVWNQNLLALPIDQRYDITDMKIILEAINENGNHAVKKRARTDIICVAK